MFAVKSIGLVLAAVMVAVAPAAAKRPEWQDVAGNEIKGKPVEVLGPFALFKSGARAGQRVLLRGLAPEDAARLGAEMAERPARAASWADAAGDVTAELPNRVMRVEQDKLVLADLTAVPEPEVLVVLFGSHNDGESWRMLGNFEPTYRRLRAMYGDRVEALFYGVRHDAAQHARIAVTGQPRWLVTDYMSQRGMNTLSRFAPREGISMVALSREGVPLVSSTAKDLAEIQEFVDGLNEIMWLTDPTAPSSWPDRLHYLNAARPVWFAEGESAPVLVGDPLRDDGLRQRGITRIKAEIEVGADGRATEARIDGAAGVPEKWIHPLEQALVQAARFSPAVARGQAVAGTAPYDHVVSAADPLTPAEQAWLKGTAAIPLALRDWLVLKPVDVPEQMFSVVEGVNEDGVVMMSAFEADTAKVSRSSQMNAFDHDWFDDAAGGAAAVAPQAGDKQDVAGTELEWRSMQADEHGFVDLQSFERRDYCIGYAWTALESPQELDAWLAIGSDEGLKIWLNGELVHDRWVRRISKLDDDIVPLKLRAGENRILIKIQNATGDWSFVSRMRLRAPR